jgi:BASS family bile acid:Na+ symporter
MNTQPYLIPVALAIIMLGIGLGLNFKDFSRVFLRPKGILLGLAGQFFLLPALGFLLAWLLPLSEWQKVGFVLIACVPGGTSSNLVTHMLKGRVALSVSLTSFNSFGILISIPLYLQLALYWFTDSDTEVNIGFLDTFKEIFSTVVLPVLGGILVHEYGPQSFVKRLQKPLSYLLPAMLFIVFGYAILFNDNSDESVSMVQNSWIFLPLLFFNISTILLGYFISRRSGMHRDGAFTIAVEFGLQNAALAILIGSSVIKQPEVSMVAVMYASFSFFSTYALVWFLKRKGQQKEERPKMF